MDKQRLLSILKYQQGEYNSDTEDAHVKADNALVEYINDKEIKEAYELIKKWYA